jgi:uncharacterized protein with HEPN domain
MPHSPKIRIDDIQDACERIARYSENINQEEFNTNQLLQDAICRNLITIGEASKQVSDEIKSKYTDIDWRNIARLRDMIVHVYNQINIEIIWDIIINDT